MINRGGPPLFLDAGKKVEETSGRGPVHRSIRLAVMRFPVISDGVYLGVTIVLRRAILFNADNKALPHEFRHFVF